MIPSINCMIPLLGQANGYRAILEATSNVLPTSTMSGSYMVAPDEHRERDDETRSSGQAVGNGNTGSKGVDLPHHVTFESRVVTYPNKSDQRTIFPPDCDDIARMSRWMTANCSDFVDLRNYR